MQIAAAILIIYFFAIGNSVWCTVVVMTSTQAALRWPPHHAEGYCFVALEVLVQEAKLVFWLWIMLVLRVGQILRKTSEVRINLRTVTIIE